MTLQVQMKFDKNLASKGYILEMSFFILMSTGMYQSLKLKYLSDLETYS